MKNYKKIIATLLSLSTIFGAVALYNISGNTQSGSPSIRVVPNVTEVPVNSLFLGGTIFDNANSLNSNINIERWHHLEIDFTHLGKFAPYKSIDVSYLDYHIQAALDLVTYYLSNPITSDEIENKPDNYGWHTFYPYHHRLIGPTMHQSIFEFEGGLSYREVTVAPDSGRIPIIGLRPENYGTINYHIIRVVEEIERLERLVGTYSETTSYFHNSGFLKYQFPTNFEPSVFSGRVTGFDNLEGMNTPMLDLIIHGRHAMGNSPSADTIATVLMARVERALSDLTAFHKGNDPIDAHPYDVIIPIEITNGRWINISDFQEIDGFNMFSTQASFLDYIKNYFVVNNSYAYIREIDIISDTKLEIHLELQPDIYLNSPIVFPLFIENTSEDYIVYAKVENLRFPKISDSPIFNFDNLPVTKLLSIVTPPSRPGFNIPDLEYEEETEAPDRVVYSASPSEDYLDESNIQSVGIIETEEQRQLPPSHLTRRRRETIVLTPSGEVMIGDTPFKYDPEEFGVPHINTLGVSVLPARMVLSLLLDENPNDNTVFIWDYVDTRFTVDPNHYNILFELYRPTLFFRDVPKPILSGVNDTAFLTTPYIDIFQNNRMFVPTRTLAEVLGYSVYWDFETANVTLIPLENK